MKKNFKAVFSLILLLSVIISCKNSHRHIPSKECISLNNQGNDSLMDYPMNGEKALNKAIDLFKQALKCDSNYFIAYMNLANAYDHKHSYNEEMIIYNKVLTLVKNDPIILSLKGMLFEKMNHLDSAKNTYDLASATFKKRLRNKPDDINLIRGIIELKAVTAGKEAAFKEIDGQIKRNPQLSSQLLIEYDIFRYFNRHAFIYGLTTEGPNK